MGSAARKAVYGNPNPPPLTLWSVQESQGLVAGSEGAVSGTRTVGDFDLWAKNSLCSVAAQQWSCSGPGSAFLKRNAWFMLAQKNQKIPRHFPCHFQKDTKAMGHVTQTFPIAF